MVRNDVPVWGNIGRQTRSEQKTNGLGHWDVGGGLFKDPARTTHSVTLRCTLQDVLPRDTRQLWLKL